MGDIICQVVSTSILLTDTLGRYEHVAMDGHTLQYWPVLGTCHHHQIFCSEVLSANVLPASLKPVALGLF